MASRYRQDMRRARSRIAGIPIYIHWTFLILIGFFTFGIGVLLIGLWVVYRVARGWLRLRDRRPMYAP